jgi:D-apiose dehydrogenase
LTHDYQKLKGVCIGAGYFSHFQYEAWQRIPEVEIVAFSNRDQTKAAEITAKFGLHEMLRRLSRDVRGEKPDFVDVITPPPSHQEICAEAARRGIHIICQKPLGPTWLWRRKSWPTPLRQRCASWCMRISVFSRGIAKSNAQLEAGDRRSCTRCTSARAWATAGARTPTSRASPISAITRACSFTKLAFTSLTPSVISRATSPASAAWLRRLNPVIKGEDCGLMVFEFGNGALGQWDANRYNEPTVRRGALHVWRISR